MEQLTQISDFSVDVSLGDISLQQNTSTVEVVEQDDAELDALNEQMLTMRQPRTFLKGEEDKDWINQRSEDGDFPPCATPYHNIRNFQQFKKQIKADQVKYGRQDFKYKMHHVRNQAGYSSIQARCYNCRMSDQDRFGLKKIILTKTKKGGDVYKVRMFDCKHNHAFHGLIMRLGKKNVGSSAFVASLKRDFELAPKDQTILQFQVAMGRKYDMRPQKIRKYMYLLKRLTTNFENVNNIASFYKLNFWFKKDIKQQQWYGSQSMDKMNGEPDLLLFIHGKSKERYQAVGQVCYLTFMDLKIKGTGGYKKIDILIISGTSLAHILQIFAVLFIEVNDKKVTNVAKIVYEIFDKLGGKVPKMLVTPSDQYYDDLISEMILNYNYKGSHIFDPIFEIDRIKNTLIKYEDLVYFKALLQSRTRGDYLLNIQKLMKNCQNNASMRYNLNRVMKLADRMIFGCMQTTEFMGMVFSISGNKMISDLIREQLLRFTTTGLLKNANRNQTTSQVHHFKGMTGSYGHYCRSHNITASNNDSQAYKISYVRCVKVLMSIAHKSIIEITNSSNYDFKPYEQVISIADMNAIRRTLKSQLLYVFGQQYGRIFQQQFYVNEQKMSNKANVVLIYDRSARSLFTVAPSPIYDQNGAVLSVGMRCNCLFRSKTGMPCSHQIQATMVSNGNLFDSIKKDWVVFQRYKKVGRPKRTRRNTEK